MQLARREEYPRDWTPIATRSRHDRSWTPLPRALMSTSQAEALRTAGQLLTQTDTRRGLSVFSIKRS